MTLEQFERFRQVVLDDLALQEALRATPDHERFLSLVLQLGEEHGYTFTADDVRTASQIARRSWRE